MFRNDRQRFQLPGRRQRKEPACSAGDVRDFLVRFLGGEDPLEEEMAAHSSIPAWRIPWTEGPAWVQSTGSQRVGHD